MKKLSVYFLLAILLPILVLGYLGYNTFAKRREAFKQLLASSLWVSAEAALRSIEGTLLDEEAGALRPDNFTRLTGAINSQEALDRQLYQGIRVRGRLFLLDRSLRWLVPRAVSEPPGPLSWSVSTGGASAATLANAESLEFAQKGPSRAAGLYRKSASLASSDRERTIALEGLGRTLLASRKYDEAAAVYRELAAKHGQEVNRANHPVAVVARLQLSEIERRRGRDESYASMLLALYREMRDGAWPLNRTSYGFFAAEIGSRLGELAARGRCASTVAAFESLKAQRPPHLEALAFMEMMDGEAVAEIGRRAALLSAPRRSGRAAVGFGSGASLVSFSILPGPRDGETLIGGFYWDPESLKRAAFPAIFEAVGRVSGLALRLVGEDGRDVLSGEEATVPAGSVTLPFAKLPFPWKLSASQTARGELEKEGRRDAALYGVFLAVIVALMSLGALLILRDISREKEAARQKAEFVDTISHEFKTPLTLIRLYGETLDRREDLSREEKKDAYEIITKEAERLTHMINNALDFSRIEMGRKEFDFKVGNLPEVIRGTLASYRYHLEKKGFLIHEEISTDLPPMEFDEEAMVGVLVNLLGNAAKFSADRKEVTVRLFSREGSAVLQVEDRGMGISARERERIFEKFYRGKNAGAGEGGGSGLGLSLVKHIVEAHGGKVGVESEPGEGSVFSVILPLGRRAGGRGGP